MTDQERLKKEIEVQKKIAYTAGLLQGDVTIKTLLESLAEGVVIINGRGRIVLINNRFSELTGYSKQEVMGESLNIFIQSKAHSKHKNHIKKFFEEPRIRPMGINLELTAKRKDNSLFPVEISLSFLDTEEGKLGMAFISDISSRKEAEDMLKLKNKELDAYAHTVAHDLNSSISGIVGLSEMLIDGDTSYSKEKQSHLIKTIAVSGRKMSNIIKEILIFATMKKEDVDIVEVDMKAVLQNALERLKFQIEKKSAKIVIQDHLVNCLGYHPWIEEIWLNYLSNAVKYGGDNPIIKIGCKNKFEGLTTYFVKDNGIGLSDELKLVAFEDQNVEKDKLTKGIGLGLSIVKRVVNKLEGKVSIQSELGKGSTFCFSLKKV